MSSYLLVLLTNPVPGREDEYNNWYTNQHVGDVIAIPGFVAAQRFKVHSNVTAPESKPAHKYLVVYEIETDDLGKTLAEMQARIGTPAMPISDAIDAASGSGTIYEAITPRILAKK